MLEYAIPLIWLIGAFVTVAALEKPDMTSVEKSLVILIGLFWPVSVLLVAASKI